MSSVTPVVFEIHLGGVRGRSFGAWWNGEHIVYESFGVAYEGREQAEIVPSDAQWARFWRTMDSLGVWHWQPSYEPGARFEPEGVTRDGTHWSLTLRLGDRCAESGGDSAGPDSVDLDESLQFAALCEAVSRLLGGLEFR